MYIRISWKAFFWEVVVLGLNSRPHAFGTFLKKNWWSPPPELLIQSVSLRIRISNDILDNAEITSMETPLA
jgi:hypothetical protein